MKYRFTKNTMRFYGHTISIVIKCLVIIISCTTLASIAYAYDLEKTVQKFTLHNGLTVLILERHVSPTVSCYIRYRVGAVDEDSKHTGTAHFLEHMLFKGTKTIGTNNFAEETKILKKLHAVINSLDTEMKKGERGNKRKIEELNHQRKSLEHESRKFIVENEIDRLYTENGGAAMNASTGYDVTTYHVNLPSNKIELWARIESDRMHNPVFREFYSERNVVIEERRQSVEARPDRKLMEQFLATAFLVHHYRRPILGWASDMPFLNIDYMKYFFKTYHAPNNTVIAIVGDVSTGNIMNIIEKYFGDISPQKIPFTHLSEEPEQNGERRIELVSDANPRMIIGYHKPTIPSYDDYVFDTLDTILSHGRTSRLYRTLVQEKGVAQSVDTGNGYPAARYPNLFVISAAPRFPHTNKELEDAIYEEIETLKNKPVSREELTKAKNQIKADFLRGLSSNSDIASTLSYFEAIAGDYRYITNQIKIIDTITAEDIRRTVNKYLTPENRTVAILVQRVNMNMKQ
ncbi:MAG: insulinase family protein [Deltaproteobacteria bacterium]|nr:insulinase family protein [Deltaproteobacteria bacterium]